MPVSEQSSLEKVADMLPGAGRLLSNEPMPRGAGHAATAPAATPAPGALLDLRFRALVGEAAWAMLPAPIQRRFSKGFRPGEIVLYRGRVALTELSRAGMWLARLSRVIGSPLPNCNGATGEAIVSVTDEPGRGSQTWIRTYANAGAPAQVIRSRKCFRGADGLEEHVGGGIGMALAVTVENGALFFRSRHYFLDLGPWRIRLPEMLSPGAIEIVHREETDGEFSFRLTLRHPRFGVLIHQLAYFKEV